jgi:hypothetical protein
VARGEGPVNMPTKALSFRQPWAELVLQGRKTMDLRTYGAEYRGRIAIHASTTVEPESCLEHGLDPAALDTGGIVGTVELVDTVRLDEASYEAHREEHLAGRGYREGLVGWILEEPERLPEMIPARGRTRLFNVDLDTAAANAAAGAVREPPLPQPPLRTPKPRSGPAAYQAGLDGTTPERPFALHVQPLEGDQTDYALSLRQRVVERPNAAPYLATIVTLSGDRLRAVADHVIESLRGAGYKATDLSPARRSPFYLPEEVGVRLGLVFLTVRPLSKFRRVEQISYGIRQMPAEEAYYWYSKCTAAETAERAQKALRVLLAAE